MVNITPLEAPDPTWHIEVDGVEMQPKLVLIRSDKYGEVGYGRHPGGFTGWLYREPEGGGAVTLPYAFSPDGSLYVGLVREMRPNLGAEPVLCVMGGMVEAGERKTDTQARESGEEGGIDTSHATRMMGRGVVQERLYYEVDVADGEGVEMFALELPFESLVPALNGEYAIQSGSVNSRRESDLVFLPVGRTIQETPDALALAAIARLVCALGCIR